MNNFANHSMLGMDIKPYIGKLIYANLNHRSKLYYI
jgi:hypothetical protein